MIPRPDIMAWEAMAPWASAAMVACASACGVHGLANDLADVSESPTPGAGLGRVHERDEGGEAGRASPLYE